MKFMDFFSRSSSNNEIDPCEEVVTTAEECANLSVMKIQPDIEKDSIKEENADLKKKLLEVKKENSRLNQALTVRNLEFDQAKKIIEKQAKDIKLLQNGSSSVSGSPAQDGLVSSPSPAPVAVHPPSGMISFKLNISVNFFN